MGTLGRFLEHARLFYFRNGGDEEYFIGSADCMKRNLESRVEVVVPVEDAGLREHLRFLLDVQLSDERSAWEMQADGSYVQLRSEKDGKAQGSQQALMLKSEKLHKEATRLRKRKTKGLARRNWLQD